jgi:glycosyltransferase involved in cell wall biosynthesis
MISVVLPCFNAVEYLPRALDSIRAQTLNDIEIIIVDDGSTDPETIAYLDVLPADIHVLRQENQGLPGARNAGFRAARGDYVVPLDCDDWLEAEFLERLRSALEASPDAGFAFAHLALEGEAGGTLVKHYNFFEQLFVNQLPYCMMFRRDLWVEADGYDESMRQGYEDWEFNIRLGGDGHYGVAVAAPLFHYQVSAKGMLQSNSSSRHGQLWRNIQRRNVALYQLPALLAAWRRWRGFPSTYPLALYFGWLALHRLLPVAWFAALFRNVLGAVSHARRATRAAAANPPPSSTRH